MAKDFISDSEMQALEGAGKAKAARPKAFSPDFISDDEMGALEHSGKASLPGPKSGAGQTALESYGNAATLGYLPHLQSLAQPGMNYALDKLTGGNVSGDDTSTYVQRRDENIARQENQSKEHPTASKIGTVAGVVGGGLITGAAMPAAAPTVVGRIVQGAKAGAGLGALANPGDKEGEFSPVQIEKRFINALIGAGTGTATAAAVEGVSAAAPKVAGWLRNKAEEKSISAIGAKGSARERLISPDGGSKVGGTLLDEGAIPILGTPKRISSRVEVAKSEAGKEVGELIRNTNGAPGIDATTIGVKILDSEKYKALRKTPGMEGLADRVDKLVDTLSGNGVMSLEQTQALRQAVDKSINFSKQVPELRGIQSILYDIRTELRDAMNQAVNATGGAKDALLKANTRYSNLADASMTVGKKIAHDAGTRSIGLTDTLAGAAGMAAKGPMLGTVAALANKAGRTFGDSVSARSLNAASKVFRATPGLVAFAQQNPLLFQSVVSSLTPKAREDSRTQEFQPWENQQLMDIFRNNQNLVDNIQDKRTREEVRKRLKRNPARQ